MQGRSRNCGCVATASSAARTSRSILRLEGDCRVGAGPPSGPYTRQGVNRALGVEGHEVQRGSGPGAVSEEAAEEFVAPSAGAEVARGGGTADRGVGERSEERRVGKECR